MDCANVNVAIIVVCEHLSAQVAFRIPFHAVNVAHVLYQVFTMFVDYSAVIASVTPRILVSSTQMSIEAVCLVELLSTNIAIRVPCIAMGCAHVCLEVTTMLKGFSAEKAFEILLRLLDCACSTRQRMSPILGQLVCVTLISTINSTTESFLLKVGNGFQAGET